MIANFTLTLNGKYFSKTDLYLAIEIEDDAMIIKLILKKLIQYSLIHNKPFKCQFLFPLRGFTRMDSFEADFSSFVANVLEITQKKQIHVGDMKNLAQQAKSVRSSFSFTRKLIEEVSNEGAASLEKMKVMEKTLQEERCRFEEEKERLDDLLQEEKEKSSFLAKRVEELEEKCRGNEESISMLADELKMVSESASILKEDLQRAHLTCASYEQQILRLNKQLATETLDLQGKCDLYEKKIEELSNQVAIMEEGMYDPEAYYCYERDYVSELCFLD